VFFFLCVFVHWLLLLLLRALCVSEVRFKLSFSLFRAL
jgi:hypothetical protein